MSKQFRRKLRNFIAFAALTTGAIHALNQLVITASQSKKQLSSKAGAFYKTRFGNMYYEKRGSGSPILLVHDLTQFASAREWDQLCEQLPSSRTVYMVDLLGCGRSDKPAITYTNFLYTQILCDFITNVIHEKTDIMASGMSGAIAIACAAHTPDQIEQLMLITPPEAQTLLQVPGKYSSIRRAMLTIPIFGTMLYHIISSRENLSLQFTESAFYNPFCTTSELVDTYYESAHTKNSGGRYLLASMVGNYVNWNIFLLLSRINNKITIIEGAKEPDIDTKDKIYVNYNPSISLVSVPNTKKLPHVESAEEFLVAIADLIFVL